ncbi:MAG: Inner rane protein YihY, formerly thought to be RNase [Myxococcaceae bacterium]|nr:Inner rane protein YihY, formerly thought to be RNase [Myxococcaceae bacterium]
MTPEQAERASAPPPSSRFAPLALTGPFHIRAWTLTKKVTRGLFKHHAFDHAATMSFYFFLGIIPLLVFGGLLLGRILQSESADELAAPLYRVMPGIAGDMLRSEIHAIASAHVTSVAPLSLFGFLWLTSNGFHNLMDVFELLIGAKQRPWWRQRVIAIGWVAATLITVSFAIWLLLVTNGAGAGFDDALHLPALLRRVRSLLAEGWHRAGVLSVFGTISIIGLATFYRVAVVHPRAVRRRVWPGTFVAMTLWAIVSWAFGTYVRTIGDYAVYYGSLATVAVLLLWLYLTSLSFIVGAEVNAQLEGVREPPEEALAL